MTIMKRLRDETERLTEDAAIRILNCSYCEALRRERKGSGDDGDK
jgi:hypothetical protein